MFDIAFATLAEALTEFVVKVVEHFAMHQIEFALDAAMYAIYAAVVMVVMSVVFALLGAVFGNGKLRELARQLMAISTTALIFAGLLLGSWKFAAVGLVTLYILALVADKWFGTGVAPAVLGAVDDTVRDLVDVASDLLDNVASPVLSALGSVVLPVVGLFISYQVLKGNSHGSSAS